MPTFSGMINNFVVGDNLDIQRSVSNIPTGQSIQEAIFTLRLYQRSSTIILQKTISGTLSDSGVVYPTYSGTCEFVFTLLAEDTAKIEPDNDLYYDIQLRTNVDKIYTPELGRMRGAIQITV